MFFFSFFLARSYFWSTVAASASQPSFAKLPIVRKELTASSCHKIAHLFDFTYIHIRGLWPGERRTSIVSCPCPCACPDAHVKMTNSIYTRDVAWYGRHLKKGIVVCSESFIKLIAASRINCSKLNELTNERRQAVVRSDLIIALEN